MNWDKAVSIFKGFLGFAAAAAPVAAEILEANGDTEAAKDARLAVKAAQAAQAGIEAERGNDAE